MYIRDPLFGNIDLNKIESKIIECEDFQRLRYIKQLGFAFLVYPGAVHSRFEHSLGAFHVTRELTRNLFKEDNEELELAGMLHDLGHTAFSHASDPLLSEFLKTNHEKIGEERIRNGGIGDVIKENGLSMDKFNSYLKGEGVGGLISGVLGADRIDYLMRDALHVGVAYGVIDYNRIKGKMTMYDGRPAIYKEGIQGAESLLISRYFMHMSVYSHHAGHIATEMYRTAARLALQNGTFDPKELLEMSDEEAILRISANNKSKKLIEDVLNRKLFKRVYYGNATPGIKKEEIVSAIEGAGLAPDEYVVDTPRQRSGHEEGLAIIDKGGEYLGNLNDFSPLVKTLIGIFESRNVLMVAAEKGKVEAASKAIQNVLN